MKSQNKCLARGYVFLYVVLFYPFIPFERSSRKCFKKSYGGMFPRCPLVIALLKVCCNPRFGSEMFMYNGYSFCSFGESLPHKLHPGGRSTSCLFKTKHISAYVACESIQFLRVKRATKTGWSHRLCL